MESREESSHRKLFKHKKSACSIPKRHGRRAALVTWVRDKFITWDYTVQCPPRMRSLVRPSGTDCARGSGGIGRNTDICETSPKTHNFVAIALKTPSPVNRSNLELLTWLDERLNAATMTTHLFQPVSPHARKEIAPPK